MSLDLIYCWESLGSSSLKFWIYAGFKAIWVIFYRINQVNCDRARAVSETIVNSKMIWWPAPAEIGLTLVSFWWDGNTLSQFILVQFNALHCSKVLWKYCGGCNYTRESEGALHIFRHRSYNFLVLLHIFLKQISLKKFAYLFYTCWSFVIHMLLIWCTLVVHRLYTFKHLVSLVPHFLHAQQLDFWVSRQALQSCYVSLNLL